MRAARDVRASLRWQVLNERRRPEREGLKNVRQGNGASNRAGLVRGKGI